MKKLSFVLAMVFAGSMAMAQNSSVISSVGDFNYASTHQGVANNNTAAISQAGSGTSLALQASAVIDQVSASWGQITQASGSRNLATISENDNDWGKIYQSNNYNSATINFGYGAGYNKGQVYQDGISNFAAIHSQSYANGFTDPLSVTQLGSNNKGMIYSGWNDPLSNYNRAYIYQTGDDNSSYIGQRAGNGNVAVSNQFNGSNNLVILQNGGGLTATINQTWTGGANNAVFINQAGGIANITQSGSGNIIRKDAVAVPLSTLKKDYFAPGEEVDMAQFHGSTLNVTQSGPDNLLQLNSNSANAFVNVNQVGLSNVALVIQH